MEVRKKRPRGFKKEAQGVQVSPLNPLSVAPCQQPGPHLRGDALRLVHEAAVALRHALVVVRRAGLQQVASRRFRELWRRRVGSSRRARDLYTRARCYSSLAFLVTIGILHINENAAGRMKNALV